jgi:hypothetical protein
LNVRQRYGGGVSAQCREMRKVAQSSSDDKSKLALLDMAQAWLTLAEQALKNIETVLVYETPVPHQT